MKLFISKESFDFNQIYSGLLKLHTQTMSVSRRIFDVFNSFPEGSVCQLHTGDAAICKNAKNCKWLIENLQGRKMKFKDIRRCSFAINEEIVCCGDEHPPPMEPKSASPCEFG